MPDFDDDDYQDDEDRRPAPATVKTYDAESYTRKVADPVRLSANGHTVELECTQVSARVMSSLNAENASVDDIMEAILTSESFDDYLDWVDEANPPMAMLLAVAEDLHTAAGGKKRNRRSRRSRR